MKHLMCFLPLFVFGCASNNAKYQAELDRLLAVEKAQDIEMQQLAERAVEASRQCQQLNNAERSAEDLKKALEQ
jgi:hypothetical protein